MRGFLAVVGALLLAACASNRMALERPGCTTASAPVARRTATGPETAQDLARRLGLGFADADTHVLLADGPTRVRIWKDSDEVSVGGESARMPQRTKRLGRNLLVPAATVSYLETKVDAERHSLQAPLNRRRTALVVPALVLPAPRPAPAKPTATPKDEPCPAPVPVACPVTADPGWNVSGVPNRPWRWIVIHHSDDTRGNLAKYDRIHREKNGWDECGYHFVIGNGSLSGDGQVEIGPRWYKQKHGAHCKTPDERFNDYGIGICLVGNFERGRPTASQMDSLVRLCRWLMARYRIPLANVVGHSDCKATACPGRNFPWAELRQRLSAP